MKKAIVSILLASLCTLVFSQGNYAPYTKVTESEFLKDVDLWKNSGSGSVYNLDILGPDERSLPLGTVVNINITFTQSDVKIFDAYMIVGLMGGTTYLEDFFDANGVIIENYHTNLVISESKSSYMLFPVIINPIEKQVSLPLGYTGKTTYYHIVIDFECDIEITASGFEPFKTHKSSKNESIFKVYLTPKVTNTTLLTNSNSDNGKSNALNVYTSKQIAEMLGLSEEDIITLIKSDKLKAKLIGDKYIIRKEDFDAYLKQ